MDKNQIIFTALTLLAGAFAKEFVAWLVGALKRRGLFKFLIHPFVIEMLANLVLLGIATRYLLKTIYGPSVVYRSDVFAIALAIIAFAVTLLMTLKSVHDKIVSVLQQKNAGLRLEIEKLRTVLEAKIIRVLS